MGKHTTFRNCLEDLGHFGINIQTISGRKDIMLDSILLHMAGFDGSFISTGACHLEEPGSNPGRAGYLSSWLCMSSAPNCSEEWSVQYCLWYCAL